MIERLATYGTLGPGRPNHHHVEMIRGEWSTGVVHGHLVDSGWGSATGFPAIELDPDGPQVRVDVLASGDLGEHWARLDEFEGEAYIRVLTPVRLDRGEGGEDGSAGDDGEVEVVDAFIYALAPEPGHS